MSNLEAFIDRNRKMRDIIIDTDGETIPMVFIAQEIIDTLDVFRLGVFAGKTYPFL